VRRRWWVLAAVGLLVLVAGASAAWYVHDQLSTHNVEGSPTVEFDTSEAPVGQTETLPPPSTTTPGSSTVPAAPPPIAEPFPRYGFDLARTHVVPYDVSPPFNFVWSRVLGLLEFPPVVAYGNLYVSNGHGDFGAYNALTGKTVWRHNYPRCAASSPVVSDGVVYQSFMDRTCPRHPNATGLIVATDAKTGRVLWQRSGPVVESSLLLVNGILYFGAWDAHVYAMDAKTHHIVWSTPVDDYVTSSVAYDRGRVFVGSDGGHFYCMSAATGKILWSNSSFSKFGNREHFYATPAVAYGRVYAPNTDGYVYSFGEQSGQLRWARQAGTYVYTAPAIYKSTVYVGTWDGNVVALDAGTGNIKWKYPAVGGITGAPLIAAGVLYYSTFSGNHSTAQRYTKSGPAGTFGLNLTTRKLVFKFHKGAYSPMVADEGHLYMAAGNTLYMLQPKSP
jgi:outer membrane protein assembly factor BamB